MVEGNVIARLGEGWRRDIKKVCAGRGEEWECDILEEWVSGRQKDVQRHVEEI